MEKDTLLSKRQLRRSLRPSTGLSSENPSEADRRVCGGIANLKSFKEALQIGLYVPIPGEPRLASLFQGRTLEKKSLFLPKVSKDTLVYLLWDPSLPLVKGLNGTLEPLGGIEWEPSAGDVLLIPGVAFDLQGNRLGHGGGFFDRLLSALPSYVLRVGVTFEANLLTRLPVDPWDQPVDVLVTEKRVLQCRNSRKQA